MATLHIVSHSPFADTRLDSCLRLLGTHDGLLLCGDAAYALMPASAQTQNLQPLIDSVNSSLMKTSRHETCNCLRE